MHFPLLEKAMERAGELLEASVRPVRLDAARHEYEDQFMVAESAMGLAVGAVRGLMERIFSGTGVVKFAAVETCHYVSERETKTTGPKVTVAEQKKGTWGTTNTETTTEVTVTEYVWKVEVTYKASVVDKETHRELESLFERRLSFDLVTTANKRPRPERLDHPDAIVDVESLVNLAKKIDRTKETCKTPRRNDEVEQLEMAMVHLSGFCGQIRVALEHLGKRGSNVRVRRNIHKSAAKVFSPAACCFLTTTTTTTPDSLMAPEASALFTEMWRTFDEERQAVRRIWTTSEEDAKRILGPDEGELLFSLAVVEKMSLDFRQGVQYLESLLRNQLEAAIGKHVTATTFDDYVHYHDRQLFTADFRPKPFSYAVRRSEDAFPDGTVAITTKQKEPIRTFTRDATDAVGRYKFAIGAATYIEIEGPRYAHAYVARTFGRQRPDSLEFVAKARPFSGFILLLGKVASKDEFLPEHAVIIQSSDDVVIPILLEPLPTPQEFADAIESLSPEQREFCEAFRRMQLASSLFGVVVVQLKPAIERVLNLPSGALLKEIQLTEHLMDLFIKYQIPTDILSYDGPADVDKQVKIDAVKAHVAAIRSVIQDARDADLQQAKNAAHHRTFVESRPRHSLDGLDLDCVSDDREECEEDGGPETMKDLELQLGELKTMSLMHLGGIRGEQHSLQKGAAREVAQPHMVACMASRPAECAVGGIGAPAPPQQGERPPQMEDDDFEAVDTMDLTQIPRKLDKNFKVLDTDSQLRPTTLTTGTMWSRTRKPSIIGDAVKTTLDLAKEKSQAFDLLDALSRSGALTLSAAELHVLICATHSFTRSITDTLIVDNVDPILKAERASLIIATTLHDKPAPTLVHPKKIPSLLKSSPFLLPDHLRP